MLFCKTTLQTIMWILISDIYRKPTVDCLHNLLFSTKFAQSMRGYVGFAASTAIDISFYHHIIHLVCSPSYLSFKYWTCYSKNSIFFSRFEAVCPKILLILNMVQVLLSRAFWNRHISTWDHFQPLLYSQLYRGLSWPWLVGDSYRWDYDWWAFHCGLHQLCQHYGWYKDKEW